MARTLRAQAKRAPVTGKRRIEVINSYEVKDALKARGFRYDGSGAWYRDHERNDWLAVGATILELHDMGIMMSSDGVTDDEIPTWSRLIGTFEDAINPDNWNDVLEGLAGVTLYRFDLATHEMVDPLTVTTDAEPHRRWKK